MFPYILRLEVLFGSSEVWEEVGAVTAVLRPWLTPRRIRKTFTEAVGWSCHAIQFELDVTLARTLSLVLPTERESTIMAIPVEDNHETAIQVLPLLSCCRAMSPSNLKQRNVLLAGLVTLASYTPIALPGRPPESL